MENPWINNPPQKKDIRCGYLCLFPSGGWQRRTGEKYVITSGEKVNIYEFIGFPQFLF